MVWSPQHGGLVFLYHPCADHDEIKKFKSLARGCLRRQVTSPYKKLPPEMNFAVLAWKCKLVLSDVEINLITRFAKVGLSFELINNQHQKVLYYYIFIRRAQMTHMCIPRAVFRQFSLRFECYSKKT